MQPINYLLDNKNPFDALMGGIGSYQQMLQNDIANQSAQDKANYLKQAQQEAQTLDYNDPNAIRQFIAKYESTGLTKGMTDYVANLDDNKRRGMLADSSKYIALVRNGDNARAAEFLRGQALAYRNSGDEQTAAEYEKRASLTESNPTAALQFTQMDYAVLLPKDAAGNYKSLIEAGAPQVKEFNAGGETGAWIRDPYTGEVTYQKLTDNSISPDAQLKADTDVTTTGMNNDSRERIVNLEIDGRERVARISADGSIQVANINGQFGVQKEQISQTEQNYRQAKTMQQEDNQVEIREVGGYMLRLYGKNGSRGVDVIGKAATATGVNGQKPLSEAQSNAYLFGTRMEANHKILTDFESKGINGSIAQHLFGDNKATNFASRPEHQQYAQAKRDFINAVLRKESGAAIGKDEFASADKQYFPQIGDSPVVIQQKQQAREQAIKGIMAAIPQGFQGNYPAASAPPSSIAKPQASSANINQFFTGK